MVFHDNPTKAAWIIGNTSAVAVAEAICRSLCNYYGVAYLPPETNPTGHYDTMEGIPGYAMDTVRKLVDLSLDMIRLLVILNRSGAFD